MCELALGAVNGDSPLSRCPITWLQIERMRTECEVTGGLGCRDSLSLYKISRVYPISPHTCGPELVGLIRSISWYPISSMFYRLLTILHLQHTSSFFTLQLLRC